MNSHTKEVVETPDQAYEAAVQFGRFTRLLSNMDVTGVEDHHSWISRSLFAIWSFQISIKKWEP